ncbi:MULTISPECIES: transglycosylase domain-containing protein [unclassified Streptomyces]|uniref:transglycosylase domain-containing protein n=2 Tax=Streptomyces TaxID=1883 RepID=UPI0036BC21A5
MGKHGRGPETDGDDAAPASGRTTLSSLVTRLRVARLREAMQQPNVKRVVQALGLRTRLADMWHSVDYPRSARQGWRRWVPSWRQSLSLFLVSTAGVTLLVMFAYVKTDIPKNLNGFATQQDNIYYWSDGTQMARSGWVSRQETSLDQVPEDVQWAVLSAENANFYSDPGISVSGIVRALGHMVGGGNTEGGSTITQQYIKNAYLNQDQTYSRKFTEVLLAVKLDNRLSKKEILEGYLNTSWFGRGTYGIQRASQAYYGKEASQLNASEGAFLASLLKGAALYDPTISAKNRERAEQRWSWTLDRMVAVGKLSREERARYTKFPEPKKAAPPGNLSGQQGYLVELAKDYTSKHVEISDAQFDLGGYQIYTTFDKQRVASLTSSVEKVRAKLDAKKRPTDTYVKTGAASVAPNGRILAVYGGPDYLKQGFNEANAVTVPAGSAFTPFVYAAGLAEGVQKERETPRVPVSPDTLYNGNDNIAVRTPEGPYWDRSGKIVKGRNDENRSWGQAISLRTAMANSVNTPFLQLGMDVGLDKVRKTAADSGLLTSSFGRSIPEFSLGNSKPSAIRMATAYGTFAAGGMHTEPYSVLKVTRNGKLLRLPRPDADRAMSPDVAAKVTDALRDSVQEGSGRAAKSLGEDAAGKTGTTQDDTAAWFVGYTPQESTAVVLYRTDLRKLELLPLKGLGGPDADSPVSMATKIWKDHMATAR